VTPQPRKKSRPKESRFAIERQLHAQGFGRVGGIDEAGRGPLAGPVCAAVVVFEPGTRINKVNDSKLLDPELREELYGKIVERALGYGVGLACAEEIDTINILRATKLAVRRALRQLRFHPDHLLLDALTIEGCTIPQRALVQGDSRCFSIAAASIIAKVTRDRLMTQYAKEFPGYGFEHHKGYATPEHKAAIAHHGPCTLHRHTFLEPWFGSTPLRQSVTLTNTLAKIGECAGPDELPAVIGPLQLKRDFFPKCEWQTLHQALRARSGGMVSASGKVSQQG